MFNLPINDERIQTLTEEQIDFMLWSELLDNPEQLRKLDEVYYDPEYEEELNAVEKLEQRNIENRHTLQVDSGEIGHSIEDNSKSEFSNEIKHNFEQYEEDNDIIELPDGADINSKYDEWEEV